MIIGVLLETPFIGHPHGRLVGDPISSLKTPCFRWRPLIFVEDPHIFIGDPNIFVGDPQFFFGATKILVGDTHIFIEDPQIFIGDPIYTFLNFMGEIMKIS